MSLNKRHANDATLEGFHSFREWAEMFMVAWMMPDIQMQVAMMEEKLVAEWEKLSDEERLVLQGQDADAYNKAQGQIDKIKSGEFRKSVIRDIAAGRTSG